MFPINPRKPVQSMASLAKKLGALYELCFGPTRMVVINSAELAEMVQFLVGEGAEAADPASPRGGTDGTDRRLHQRSGSGGHASRTHARVHPRSNASVPPRHG
ncbi:hypothetical protein [Nocardia goodfellowii]|uniref:hypothetical protein n=1 Tax=Nocardia goodfellowii TaxID=882446 RepID=UPI00355883C4